MKSGIGTKNPGLLAFATLASIPVSGKMWQETSRGWKYASHERPGADVLKKERAKKKQARQNKKRNR